MYEIYFPYHYAGVSDTSPQYNLSPATKINRERGHQQKRLHTFFTLLVNMKRIKFIFYVNIWLLYV